MPLCIWILSGIAIYCIKKPLFVVQQQVFPGSSVVLKASWYHVLWWCFRYFMFTFMWCYPWFWQNNIGKLWVFDCHHYYLWRKCNSSTALSFLDKFFQLPCIFFIFKHVVLSPNQYLIKLQHLRQFTQLWAARSENIKGFVQLLLHAVVLQPDSKVWNWWITAWVLGTHHTAHLQTK